MEGENAYRLLLGISQQNLATLLKVSREHLALYETGKRNLPERASIILADILTHAQNAGGVNADTKQDDEHVDAFKIHLNDLLSENEYQIVKATRNKIVLDKKYSKQLKTLQVANYLSHHLTNKSDLDVELLNTIAKQASKKIDFKERIKIYELDIKLEKLEFEKSLLTTKLAQL